MTICHTWKKKLEYKQNVTFFACFTKLNLLHIYYLAIASGGIWKEMARGFWNGMTIAIVPKNEASNSNSKIQKKILAGPTSGKCS